MSFLWPWLLVLLPLPFLLRQRQAPVAQNEAVRLPPDVAAALAEEQTSSGPKTGLHNVLYWLIWCCLLISAAQPQWKYGSPLTSASGRSLMLVMDLSGSMERRDFILDGQTMNRLEVVKAIAGDFIVQRDGDRLGLVLFGDEAFIASPLSFDLIAVRHALNESAIGMAGRTTALGDALGLALVKMRDDSAGERAVILLTDGTHNAGNADPLSAAELAADWGIRVYTIGLGSHSMTDAIEGQDPSAELDTWMLKAIAQKAGGQYFRADSSDALKAIYEEIDKLEEGEFDAPSLQQRRDIRHLFLLTALLALLALLGLRLWPSRGTQ